MGKKILDQERIEGAIELWHNAPKNEVPAFDARDAPWSQFAYETTSALENYGFSQEDAKAIVAVTLENSTYDDVHGKAATMYQQIAFENAAPLYAFNATIELMRKKGISQKDAYAHCFSQVFDARFADKKNATAGLDVVRGLVSLARWADKRTLKDLIDAPRIMEPGYEEVPAQARPKYGWHPAGGEPSAYRSNPDVASDKFEN